MKAQSELTCEDVSSKSPGVSKVDADETFAVQHTEGPCQAI